jgi:hypothetical protein
VQDPLAVQAILAHLARSNTPAPPGPAPPAPSALTSPAPQRLSRRAPDSRPHPLTLVGTPGPPPPLRPLLDRRLAREPAPEQDGRVARAITMPPLAFALPERALPGPVPRSRGGRTGRDARPSVPG